MSVKICVPAWNLGPHETKDAVTLGMLEQMMDALGQFGYDVDTPVTFLFDEDHVWLETVEWEPEPRVVEELDDTCKKSKWMDVTGDWWRWNGIEWETRHGYFDWYHAEPDNYGPFTEAVE